MRRRCHSPTDPAFKYYGDRGIKVCERWRNSFNNFLEDIGECPGPEYSIDRIDNDGDYTPDNCRWATMKEQAQNTRRNVFFEFNGERLTLSAWANRFSIPMKRLWARMHTVGWSFERAITTPVRQVSKLVRGNS